MPVETTTIRLICQVLAPRDNSKELEQALSASPDWPAVIKLASEQLVLPAFCQALRDKNLFQTLPTDMQDYFDAIQELSAERSHTFLAELTLICRELNAKGIVPVILKGGAALLDTIYSDPLTRIMSDLDLLIPPAQHANSVRILHTLGYYEHRVKEADDYHDYHPLLKKNCPVVVELHHTVTDADYVHILPTTEVLRDSQQQAVDNNAARILSPTHRMIHNIVHTQMQDSGYALRSINLRQLFECAMLSQHYHDEINWQQVALAFASNNEQQAMQHYLVMCQAYFSLPRYIPLAPAAQVEALSSERLSQRDRPRGRMRQLLVILQIRTCNVLRKPSKLLRLLRPTWYAAKRDNIMRFWRRRG